MVHTSDPQGMPAGVVTAVPCRPDAASRSRFGVSAASNGVRSPSSLSRSSAAPSGMMMTYFMG